MKGRSSWAMAYCGMAAALSVALMLLGAVVPVLMFIAPAAASLLIATVCMECGMKMALTAYGAVSLLSLLFVPDKEVALVFVFLLGYYPLVKPKFEAHPPEAAAGRVQAAALQWGTGGDVWAGAAARSGGQHLAGAAHHSVGRLTEYAGHGQCGFSALRPGHP